MKNVKPLTILTRLTIATALIMSVQACNYLPKKEPKAKMQGVSNDTTYFAPQKAFDLSLTVPVFRGEVLIEERCNRTGSSVTLYDSHARMFAVDSLIIDRNDLAKAPSFASNQTMMNMVLNNYLRNVVRKSNKVVATDTVSRRYIRRDDKFDALFTLVDMEVDTTHLKRETQVKGTYYYGFLLFKQGDRVFVVQHRQPALMPNKMERILLALADSLVIPGTRIRSESEVEKFSRDMDNLKVRMGFSDAEERQDGDSLVCEDTQWSEYN